MKVQKIVIELTINEAIAVASGLTALLRDENLYPNVEVNAARRVRDRIFRIKEVAK